MVFCIGGDKHPRSNTPLEPSERKNAESRQYCAGNSSIAKKKSEFTIERRVVVDFALGVADFISLRFGNASFETK